MSDKQKCNACGLEIHRDSDIAYMGESVRHKHRSDCIQPLRDRIAELERQLAKVKKVITDMPCHVWHTDGQEHLCAACQGREAIDAARKERG